MERGQPQAEHGAHTGDTQAFPSMLKIFSGHLKVMVRRQTNCPVALQQPDAEARRHLIQLGQDPANHQQPSSG